VLRDVGYLNRGNVCAKRCGCHIHAPGRGGEPH
jgi:hypothetical protein